MRKTQLMVTLWFLFCIAMILFWVIYIIVKNQIDTAEVDILSNLLTNKWRINL